MKGFDPKFIDLPDYIIGITREIWEERGIVSPYTPANNVVGPYKGTVNR